MAPVAVDRDAIATSQPVATAKQPSTSAFSKALTLDFAQWRGPEATTTSRQAFLTALRQACAGLGFFYLTNTPLDQGDLRQRLFALNRAFFRLPVDVRQRISIVQSPHFRGFSRFGDERTQAAVDHRDQVDYGLETEAITDEDRLTQHPFLHLVGPNQFLPDDILPGHRALVLEWLDICQTVAYDLTEALEQALGAPTGSLLHCLTGQKSAQADGETDAAVLYARMKTIRYPVAASIDGVARLPGSTQGVGAHKDGGWITILATSPHRGLQVQAPTGDWLDVDHHPHAMVINFGQQIERVSRGAIDAATHRVLSHVQSTTHDRQQLEDVADPISGDRFSIAYFSMPALNVVVKPLQQSDLSPAMLTVWQQAQQVRHQALGSTQAINEVPHGDLWGAEDAPFGVQAWKGIVRSHPNVVERYGYVA